MSGQENKQVDDRVDAESDGRSEAVPMTDTTVDRAPKTVKEQVSPAMSDETVAEGAPANLRTGCIGDGDHDAAVGNLDQLDHVSCGGAGDNLGSHGLGSRDA